jgi:hypothetical protein
MTPDEIMKLAVDRYSGAGYGGIGDCMFALLVDVGDAYVKHLEAGPGADDPAPFLGGTTPMEAAMASLAENLQMLREPEAGAEAGLLWLPRRTTAQCS